MGYLHHRRARDRTAGVKCDGRPNGCRNCERLQLDCVGDDGTPLLLLDGGASEGKQQQQQPGGGLAALRKIRTYRSCQSCRLSKTKCNGDRPRCARCVAKGAECVYDGGSAPRWTRSLKRGSGSGSVDVKAERLDGESRSPDAEGALTSPAAAAGGSAATTSPDGGMLDADDAASSSRASEGRHGQGLSMGGSGDVTPSHPLSWLLSPELPAGRSLRRVVEQYFANVHPLRCFAFVHKPSFMRQLDRGFASDDESALLHIICAHGAKFLLLGSGAGDLTPPPPPAGLRGAGNQWARRAEYLLLANFGKISVQRLMTAILLHDFHFRLGEYGQALMISGLAVRMAHALKINAEYNADVLCADERDAAAPSVASRESRRRLMWACYVLDAWAGSGVDQLTLLRESDIKIQLPCNERNFGLRIPSVTETLGVGHVLQFLPPAIVPRRPAANMGIMAYYIRVVALWKRIVRYVAGHGLHAGPPPWQPDSPFAALDADLHLWRRELPDFVEYSTETIYARLDSNQLGALVLIHCTYHHNYLELYKITMPDLFKLAAPFHHEFLHTMQANCYYHAAQIADILAEAAEHGARLLSDSLLPFFIYDSSRVMLYYVARLLDPTRPDAEAKMRDAIRAVESNNRVLRLMSTLFPVAQSLSTTIERWLAKVQRAKSQDDLVSSLQSEHRLEATRSELLNGARESSEFLLPPLHSLARSGSSATPDKRTPGLSTGGGTVSVPESPTWSTVNPNAASGSWDGTSAAAHQLVGLSAQAAQASSLQHERPVVPQQQQLAQGPPVKRQGSQPMCEALDLDDLQNFLSWDMYGIMEMGGGVFNDDMDDSVSQSWTGAI
ncbi:fungal transcriptional regulatory protein [Purpureocillium lavendulum]|uniref:Fungal transcriptional regulatory protein n=1 Tax=Purpureocillium lavendulum TaxID=1247861 RepID=A0AB34FR25_9HYPO|nr:fungal transcriptional regulatory protein [Purpureocillium lavendulum]